MTTQYRLQRILKILPFMAVLFAGTTFAQTPDDEGPAVTVYSTADAADFDPQRYIAQQRMGMDPNFVWQVPGYAVVKEIRSASLQPGINDLQFTDVAEFIDPTTVSFTDLSHPDATRVLEQNFRFDLVSPGKLLDRYIDQDIGVYVQMGDGTELVKGTLLSSANNSLVIQTSEGIRVVNGLGQSIQLGNLPSGLITRPTLLWKIDTTAGGDHKFRTAYQTNGMTWRADYNIVVNDDSTRADIGAWVSLLNLSGATFENARLKLIAGDVQRIQPQQPMYPMAAKRMRGGAEMADAGFQEKSFFEYHLYTLPRRTDIASNTTQQITLFPTARDVGVEKTLVYFGQPQSYYWRFGSPAIDRNLGTSSNTKVDVYLKFKNAENNQLGRPLPKGKVRVYQRDDADDTLEFIGEDLIDHTAKDETVLIKLGQSFDVVGDRKQMDFEGSEGAHRIVESFEITLRNHKPTEQKVIVREALYRWSDWEITRKSDNFEKIDSRTIHFPVIVPADGEKTVTYTVRYTW
ncbi:MAG: DUF4139 domain-containing protein [Phycisphaerales bacterium]|nr:DUF4139 domain-containing protein [Phycisphaerales bacterium]MCB9862625.1 DUF4139 domain-containing protein [Phycisphaerales bacterium]